ncbi:MAG: hypothetical protein QNJ44_18350 [Rhodobacter sp.]|nr:hypothetical protein [Rhodobacter sp.]
MDWLIWTGAAVSLLGVAGLVWCIVIVARAKRANLSDNDLNAQLRRVIPLNMGALFLSAIGLMMVVIGITLG